MSKHQLKAKKRRGNVILIAVLLIGCLFLFFEPIKNWIVSQGAGSLGINRISAREIEKNIEKKATFNFEDVKELDFNTILMANLNKDDITIIGGISIPGVNMNLPIGKGTSSYTLALTAGTMKADQVMGEGNYALAGHHMKRGDLLFSPLYQVKIGAAAYLTDLQYIYEYQIDEQRIIEATDIEVIDDQEDKGILTLITCDADGVKRVLTRGYFVEKVPIEKASKETVEAFEMALNNK